MFCQKLPKYFVAIFVSVDVIIHVILVIAYLLLQHCYCYWVMPVILYGY